MDPNAYESPIIDNLNNLSGDDGDIISPQGVYSVEDWIINNQAVVQNQYGIQNQYGVVVDTAVGGVVAFLVFIAVSQVDLTP